MKIASNWCLLRVLTLSAVSTALASCESDDEARLQGPNGTLAVGGFADLWLLDACPGGGKINFCTSEDVVRLTSLTVDDPDILRLVPATELPAGFVSNDRHIIVQGSTPGKAAVHVEALFNDGSTRSTSVTVNVAAIDGLAISPLCDTGAQVPERVLPGRSVDFVLQAKGGGKVLAGFFPDAASGDAVTCAPPSLASGRLLCSWAAPAAGGNVTVTSHLRTEFAAQLATYAAADVASVEVNMNAADVVVNSPGHGGGRIPGHVRLRNGRPCQGMPLQAKTLTPSICAGRMGEASWTETSVAEIKFSTLAAGQCRLALGAAGAASTPTQINFPVSVVTEFTASRAVFPETPCAPEGAAACMSGFTARGVCMNGRWQRTDYCPDGRLCEVQPTGTAGCAGPDGCVRCR